MSDYFDIATLRELFAGPGQDPRNWVSYGTVLIGTPDQPSVRFNDEDGAPLEVGVLVDVELHPSGVVVPCRVAMQVSGAGCGEFHPFVDGDEVIVVIPEGSERAGCVIVGRLTNKYDAMPANACGQDATGNNFAFKRLREPYLLESGTAVQIRNAKTTAQFVLDQDGGALLSSGDGHALAMNASAVSLQLGDGSAQVQLVPGLGQVSLAAKSASLLVDELETVYRGKAIQFQAGSTGGGHAVTLEQVFALLANYTVFLRNNGLAAFLSGLLATPNAFDTAMATFATGCTLPTPWVTGSPVTTFSGVFPEMLQTFGPVGAVALGLAPTNVVQLLAPIDITGFVPGFGRPAFRL